MLALAFPASHGTQAERFWATYDPATQRVQEVEASGAADPTSHALQLVEFAGRYDPASHGGKHIAEPGGMPGQGVHDLTPTPPKLERLVCAGHGAHELNWRVGGT